MFTRLYLNNISVVDKIIYSVAKRSSPASSPSPSPSNSSPVLETSSSSSTSTSTATPSTTSSTTTIYSYFDIMTKGGNKKQNNNNNKAAASEPSKPVLKTKAQLPAKISQCALALQGNRFYSTKPGAKVEPYLGPPPYLNDIVKLELLKIETPETIKEIWLRYHAEKDTICAVIPADTYKKLRQRAKSCPLFVFPLPGDKGYISILYQFQQDNFMYTFLDQFKKYTTQAVPWLSAQHYTDLMDSKGIVLMRADPNLEVLNTIQAQYLYNQTQIFLLDDKKFNIMQTFTYNPQQFDFNAVLREIDQQKSVLESNQQSLGITDKSHKVIEFENTNSKSTSNTTSTSDNNNNNNRNDQSNNGDIKSMVDPSSQSTTSTATTTNTTTTTNNS